MESQWNNLAIGIWIYTSFRVLDKAWIHQEPLSTIQTFILCLTLHPFPSPTKDETSRRRLINMAKQPLCHIVTPVGMLGYGFDESVTASALARLVPTGVPTAMILDSGSTDSGPEKLALGSMSCPRAAYHKDLTKLLRLVRIFRVPLIFASAGGDGSDEHVKVMMEIMEEIAAEKENQ